jgi:hypothetical protein
VTRFSKEVGKSYRELEGYDVEQLEFSLESRLEDSVAFYDDDSADYIESLYAKTVSVTIGFSFILMIYYVVVIFVLLT